ncbi:low-density lipoprotein receptor domain-containing jelly belly protein [Haematobia irritans]|uniref:low-density lipoprotein receptor domain-containing jelly belly protein n=1 Tax=Haematobia irritans TaxID=7368 RepID=UPI003F5052B4
MFFSLIQTLVCVLLVNGGLYALHLTGSGPLNGPGSNGANLPLNANNGGHSSSGHLTSSSSASSSSSSPSASSSMKNPSANPFQTSANRLSEGLADLAQRERERLMAIGLAKQTAEESGYHGRPVITGRIKMHPVDDMDSDYSNWLNAQARNVMFGSVVKQPSPPLLNDGEEGDYNDAEELAMNYELRRPTKYEYGRVVQPPLEREFESPHTLDMDDFMELEQAAEEEDVFPDLDGYAYLEDLMAEENRERLQQHHQNVPQFPGFRQQQQHQQHNAAAMGHNNPYGHVYQTQEHLPVALPQTLEEILEKEQQQQQQHASQQQQQQHQFNSKYRNNIKLQQKWARKRAQQLPRNIFGQKNNKVQQQQHFFKTLNSNKLSLANSEATATSKIHHNTKLNEFQTNNGAATSSASSSSSSNMDKQNDNDNDNTKSMNEKSDQKSSQIVSAIGEQQKPDPLLLHPSNHKRSGSSSSASGAGTLTSSSAAAIASVTSPHSLANQLMLRSARGQRQYDVPQIECPTAMDGMERFACPTPDVQGRYRCIDDHVLCDGFIDCPEGEDEDRRSCMFYKTTKAHLDVLADALLRWARGR